MRQLFLNALRLLRSPKMAKAYGRWLISQAYYDNSPIAVGEFLSFSEYWLWRNGLDAEEIALSDACYSVCSKPSAALDVGANIGFFSLALSKAGFDSVIPFEPVPLTVQRLRRNLARNPTVSERIIALNFGLGDFRGPVQFEESRQSPGQNRIAIATSPTRRDTSFCKIESLDEALTNLGIREIGFLKLDVEGFESAVVQGEKNSLFQHARFFP
ncbi:MAG: hypothetical protein DME49_03960 [Verrucomicrobia bacterium]|nr:MAG: hypothetical protein DME49_03960 [Verrucomicrobiota bacterium]PYK92537.1 MAG: hypothetical protein DME36_13200 [Verrucomicrobiota bacterium]PYL59065.1 MAG: hypothetical protein DMF30_00630 [Verrucomicrobiota bacterium]